MTAVAVPLDFAAPHPSSRQPRIGRLAAQNPIGLIGLVIITAVILIAIGAPLLAPTDPTAQNSRRLLEPSGEHLMGTDELGRDVLSRILFGSRISLYVGFVSVSIAIVLGVTTGVISGFYGRHLDTIVMRFVDVVLAFPALVLAIMIAGLLGPNLTNAMLAIGVVYAPAFARVARGSVLTVMSEPYIEAARLLGGTNRRIIVRHVLPNVLAPLIVLATLSLSTAILTEASLSFLGLGAQPPQPSWGTMLNSGRRVMEIAPWVVIFPGLAIMLVVQGFNFFGDGLRDALDPKLRGN
jgi:peptide/nickel transport system permease protein